MNNHYNYYDESIAEYVLNSPHPELIMYCDDKPIGSYKDENGYLHKGNYLVNDHGTYEPEIQYLKPELAVCECCGAPLHGNKCEYCGSTYIWR
jgi:hypothetical protein